MATAAVTEAVAKRFWAKVEKNGPIAPSFTRPCWLWRAATDDQGYPRFKLNGATRYARRVLFYLNGRALAADEVAINLCGCRFCVNPDHHTLGSYPDLRRLWRASLDGYGDRECLRLLYREGGLDPKLLAQNWAISEALATAFLQAE